jgi:SET domain-containing protein
VDVSLAYVNEPRAGSCGCNVRVEEGSTAVELLFVTTADISAGQEIFVDYGTSYDRSQYRAE